MPGGEGQIPYDLTFNWNIINIEINNIDLFDLQRGAALPAPLPLNVPGMQHLGAGIWEQLSFIYSSMSVL